MKFVLKTGNLTATVAATAKTFGKTEEIKDWKPQDENNRLAVLRYKVTKDMTKKDKELGGKSEAPASFVVEVPKVSAAYVYGNVARGAEMLESLFAEYQDGMLKAAADGDSDLDATDIAALVADYFDTSKERKTPKLEDIEVWSEEIWKPVYLARVDALNETAKAEGRAIQSADKVALIAKQYPEKMRAIAKRQCAESRISISLVKQNIERLQELGLIEADDEFACFLVKRANEHIAVLDKAQDVEESEV